MTVQYTAIGIVFTLLSHSVLAQHGITVPQKDSSSLFAAFKNGKTEGHFRYFFMATDNKKGLTDYHAHATGGGLSYTTAAFHGFRLGIGGFFIFNTGSSDLIKPDPLTQQLNRYEIGLFDIENPSNKNDIDRLEELYMRYSWKKNSVTLGKQIINTPFINPQDGRMRPTGVEGVWLKTKKGNVKIDGGVLWGISPRSTVRWFNIGQSFGIYPQGVNEAGKPSNYRDHINSRFIGLIGITYPLSKQTKIQLWEQFTDQVFNTIMLQADQQFRGTDDNHYYAAAQTIVQHSLNNGGSPNPDHKYMQKGNSSFSFGARIGWKKKTEDISFNYTRITRHGRYLMPREWGRDPLFTFLPRERNEGFGDLNAWMLQYKKQFGKSGFQLQTGLGYYQLPDVLNTQLNKYGMPSYTQLNIDLQYQFKGLFSGAQAQLLYVYKGQEGNSYNNDKYVIHKVNASLFNLILNYRF
jgi:hypothetical protein